MIDEAGVHEGDVLVFADHAVVARPELSVDETPVSLQSAVSALVETLLRRVSAAARRRAIVLFASGPCSLQLARSYARTYARIRRIRPSQSANLEVAHLLHGVSGDLGWGMNAFVLDDRAGLFDAKTLGSRMVGARRCEAVVVCEIRFSRGPSSVFDVTATLFAAPAFAG